MRENGESAISQTHNTYMSWVANMLVPKKNQCSCYRVYHYLLPLQSAAIVSIVEVCLSPLAHRRRFCPRTFIAIAPSISLNQPGQPRICSTKYNRFAKR